MLVNRLDHLPGANAAGGFTSLPFSQAFAWTPITVEGRTPVPGEKFLNADERLVGGHYFEAMGIPLRRGRFFTDQDDPTKIGRASCRERVEISVVAVCFKKKTDTRQRQSGRQRADRST